MSWYTWDNWVFKLNARPWIDSDGATVEEIINTIRKGPSGALSYSINGIEYKDQNERKPMITVSKDGPYIITGGIDLIGDNWDKTKDSHSHEFTKFIDSFDTS